MWRSIVAHACTTESVNKCPIPLRQVFHRLQQDVMKKWPDNEQVKYICVSGYIFLRFFNAAILVRLEIDIGAFYSLLPTVSSIIPTFTSQGPKLFGLCSDHPNQRVSRTLTLISKTLQNLANLVRFDGMKEPFMTALNDFIVANIDRMKVFIKYAHHLASDEEFSDAPFRALF